MLGLEHARAVIDILPQQGLGLVNLAEVPEESAQTFGRVQGDRVVAAELAAAIRQVAAQERLGLCAAACLFEKRGQQIGGAERVAMLGAVKLGVEPDRR